MRDQLRAWARGAYFFALTTATQQHPHTIDAT
jgi:hypothetical protein